MAATRDERGRPEARFHNGPGLQTWIDASELRSAFAPDMQVEHAPHGRHEASLGVGEVAATRRLAGCEQVLVQFLESGAVRWLPFETLRRIKPVEDRLLLGDVGRRDDHAERFRLRLLAHALEAWDRSTGALGRLDIDPLPHQTHLAHKVLTSGEAGWLIADDVGLGKTVEVGLILHGLAKRDRARRVLIVCPAGLVRQWQEEMKLKFEQDGYEIYGRDFRINDPAHWRLHDKVIASLDLAKRPEQRAMLLRAGGWDVVVFDEAHRLGRDEGGGRTDRYRLAEQLRASATLMLLLTATPHQGKTHRFAALLELARPDLREGIRTIEADPEIVGSIVLRNRKTKVTDAAGRPLFHGHDTHRFAVEPDAATRAFADALDRYLRHGYAAAEREGTAGRAIGFVMATYRKLASSSIAAVLVALTRRYERLVGQGPPPAAQRDLASVREAVETSAEDLDRQVELVAGAAFFEDEAAQLRRLLRLALPAWGADVKLLTFVEQIVRPNLARGNKLLVFTEYRATQTYLAERLRAAFPETGEVALINGSMGLDEKLESIRRFKDGAMFLVSTEAGGEGLNLHERCHVMVNYDLPWNPSRLVQRIGRLYRYGQKNRVVVINLHAQDGFDNKVIALMLDRVGVMARDLAAVSPDYSEALATEILGGLLQSIDLEAILERSAAMRLELSEAEVEEALARARDAQRLEEEILSYATGYDAASRSGAFGIDGRHVKAFLEGMLPRIGATEVRPAYGGRALRFELPDALVDAFPEFGRRRVVTVALDRRLAMENRDATPADFASAFFQHLVAEARSRAFDGLYAATSAGLPTPWLGLYFLRWQDARGEPLEDEIIAVGCGEGEADGRRLRPEEFASVLLGGLESAGAGERGDREQALTALRRAFEREVRRGATGRRQPCSVLLVAAAEQVGTAA